MLAKNATLMHGGPVWKPRFEDGCTESHESYHGDIAHDIRPQDVVLTLALELCNAWGLCTNALAYRGLGGATKHRRRRWSHPKTRVRV